MKFFINIFKQSCVQCRNNRKRDLYEKTWNKIMLGVRGGSVLVIVRRLRNGDRSDE